MYLVNKTILFVYFRYWNNGLFQRKEDGEFYLILLCYSVKHWWHKFVSSFI